MFEKRYMEFNLKTVFSLLLKKKKLVGGITGVFILLGVIFSFSVREVYVSSMILMPENTSGSMGSASSLLSQFGIGGSISMGEENTRLDPFFFQYVMEGYDFKNYILNCYLNYGDKGDSTTYRELMKSDIGKSFVLSPFAFLSSIFPEELEYLDKNEVLPDGIVKFSVKEQLLIRGFENTISVDFDQLSNTLIIITSMPDPLASSVLALRVSDYLKEYASRYSIVKSKETLDFVELRYDEILLRYNKAQENLARFNSKNRSLVDEFAKIKESQLENEFNLSYELFSSVSQQVEQAKVSLQEKRMIFTVFSQPEIPPWRSEPKRKIIVLLFTMVGLFFGIGFVILKNYRSIFYEK